MLTSNRMIDVPDEVIAKEKESHARAVEESKRDRTFEEFQKQYLPHLEGKVDAAARTANRPETVPWNDGHESRGGQRTGMSRVSNRDNAEAPNIEAPGESSVRKSLAAVNQSKEKSSHKMGSTVHSNTKFAS